MSRLRYDQQSQGGGGVDGPKAILLAAGLVVLAPAVLLGLAGAFAWRRVGWRRRTAVLLFLASLIPATAAAYYWHTNPVLLFLQAHLSVVGALMLMAIGRGGSIPTELTPALYAVAIAPAVLPLAFLVAAVAGWLGRPKTSLLQQRQAEPIAVPRHVERRASRRRDAPTRRLRARLPAPTGSPSRSPTPRPASTCSSAARPGPARRPRSGTSWTGSPTAARSSSSTARPPRACAGPSRRSRARSSGRSAASCSGTPSGATRPASPRRCWRPSRSARTAPSTAPRPSGTSSGSPVCSSGPTARATPRAIARLLEPKTLAMRLRELRADAPAAWWDRHGDPIARNVAEMGKAEEEGVAGFKVRFGSVVEGVAGDSLGAEDDALVLEDAVRAGRVVLFSLDAAAYPSVAAKIGAWVLLDLVRVAGLLQAEERPLYAVVDEFSALGRRGSARRAVARARPGGRRRGRAGDAGAGRPRAGRPRAAPADRAEHGRARPAAPAVLGRRAGVGAAPRRAGARGDRAGASSRGVCSAGRGRPASTRRTGGATTTCGPRSCRRSGPARPSSRSRRSSSGAGGSSGCGSPSPGSGARPRRRNRGRCWISGVVKIQRVG